MTICLVPSMSFAGPIHDAAKKGDVTAIAAALDSGASVNELDGGATPLYWAARRGHLGAAKLLIERGAEVNATTKFGPALMAAVEKSKIELITLLLAKGADPNASLGGTTVLHVAAGLTCFDCLKALVVAGADVNAQASDAATPLHLARRRGTREMADYLMAHGVVLPKPAPIADKLATADVEQGRIVFNGDCLGCHTVDANERRSAGPNLWNLVGRDKASEPGFSYSDVLLGWKGVWTYEDLNTFIAAPMATTPGVRMDIPGVPDETERAHLIAYLRTLSDAPIPLP